MRPGSDRDEVVVRISDVCKSYGSNRAVHSVSLSIGKDEVYCLVGLNGAGKTTLIRMMPALIRPSSGTIQVFGQTITPNASDVFDRISYLSSPMGMSD